MAARAVAREQAEAIARAAGMTFTEALRSIGRLPPLPLQGSLEAVAGSHREVARKPLISAHPVPPAHLSTVAVRGLSEVRAAEILTALRRSIAERP